MNRGVWAILLNAVLPGVGLIVLRREWLGVVTALLFGMVVQLGIWGRWLIPAIVPGFITTGAIIGATMIWIGGQIMLFRQWRFVSSPDVRAEFARLIDQADAAWGQGDLTTTRQILIVARSIDDEDVGINVRWARLMEREGQVKEAWATANGNHLRSFSGAGSKLTGGRH